MNYGPLLFLGIFLTVASSWCGLVLIPYLQFGRQEALKIEETGQYYPQRRPGLAEQGMAIYRANGCVYCHSQQVRREGYGADIARGWGQRRSVTRDYLYDKPVMLGTMRTGPDLTNIGLRQASASWQYLHLYNPRITSKGSIMPSLPFLFVEQPIKGRGSPEALQLPPEYAPKPGFEVIPSPEARELVAYLLSLKANTPLPEAQ